MAGRRKGGRTRVGESTGKRLKRMEYSLAQGKMPIIKRHLPGSAAVLRKWGLLPNIDVFCPGEDYDMLSPEEKTMRRNRFRWNRTYRRQREAYGEYKSLDVRRAEGYKRQLAIMIQRVRNTQR